MKCLIQSPLKESIPNKSSKGSIKSIFSLLICVLFVESMLFSIMGVASATTIYVATDGTGNYNTDGIDDHIEINQVLAYINSIGGGTVHLKAGTYTVNDRMYVYSNTILEGDGDSSIVKIRDYCSYGGCTATENGGLFENGGSSANNVVFRDFKQDGNKANQGKADGLGWIQVVVFNGNNYSFINMTWVNNTDDVIIPSGNIILVRNNTARNHGHAFVYSSSATNLTVENSSIAVRSNAGVRPYNSRDVLIRNNDFYQDPTYGNGDGAILVDQQGSYIMTNITIENNTIRDMRRYGILLLARYTTAETNANGVVIRNNRIYYSGRENGLKEHSGIQINNFNNTIIINNVIYNNRRNGIWFGVYDDIASAAPVAWNLYATVKNNIIVNNTECGLYVDNTGTYTYTGKAFFKNDYNVIWNNNNNFCSGTSKGTNDLIVDPYLVNAPMKSSWSSASQVLLDLHEKSTTGTYNDTTQTWDTYSLHSPAIDAGDPSSDYSKEIQPNGGRINIGAYGNTLEASKSPGGSYGNNSGTLTNKISGAPIAGAIVTDGIKTTTTDALGKFFLVNILTGSRNITASKNGYQTASKTITIVENSTVIADFQLNPLILPIITSFSPTDLAPSQDEGSTYVFSVTVDQPVTNRWFLDSNQQPEVSQIYTKTWSYTDAGAHNITYSGENANGTVSKTWIITVNNVADITPPVITGVNSSSVTSSSAIITWTTNEPATSQVEYGLSTSYGSNTILDSSLVPSHNVTLTGLTSNTAYYYRVKSKDADNNLATSSDYSFISMPYTAISLTASNDTSIKSGAPDLIRDSNTWIDLGRLAGSTFGNYRGLLYFNLSAIPSTAQITSAALILVWEGESRNQTTIIDVFRPSVAWDTYATWNSRQNGVSWTTSGGDWFDKNGISYGTSPYAEVTHTLGLTADVSFDVTSLVQKYVSGTYPNTGFFLKANEVDNTYISFYSSESLDSNQRPRLVINYTTAQLSDTIPPASITSLYNTTYSQNYIRWTWTDPADQDLDHVEVYLDGIFRTNVIKGVQFYNATGLTLGTSYTISTKTVDTSGNINSTWVNHTARTSITPDTTPPASITDLQNITYDQTYINWTWTDPVDADLSKIMIYLNSIFQTNVTKGDRHYNASGLSSNTSFTISTHAVDASGNINVTWVNHTARTAPTPISTQPTVTNPSSSPSTIPDDTDSDPRWGEISRLNVTVTSSTNIASVTIDLSAIGGSPAQPMANIGGNIWSVTTSAPSGTLPQIYDLKVNATDINGNSTTSVGIPLTVVKNGDINGNGVVNIADAMLLANYASYPGQYNISSSAVADVTGDGSVNIADAMYLANYATTSGYILH